MNKMEDNHRGHSISTHVKRSNLNSGPYIASYVIWRIDPNNSYHGVLSGNLKQSFDNSNDADSAAMKEARKELDAILDKDSLL